jgi:hypothetical protein
MSRWDCYKGGRVSLSEFYSFTGRHVTGTGYRGRKATWLLRKGVIYGKPDLAIAKGKPYDLQHFVAANTNEGVTNVSFLVYTPEFFVPEHVTKELGNPPEDNGISLLEKYQLQVNTKGDCAYHDINEDWRGQVQHVLKLYPFMIESIKVVTWEDKAFYPLGSFSYL